MTSPLPLVERKRRQARQRIIRAAEELFSERDFDDVSVGDIAERAEVGRTTFFRHFGDKQEVVFAKQQELLETITAAGVGAAPAARSLAEAVEQLRPVVLALCTQAAADPAAYAHHFQLVGRHPELRARDAVKTQQIAGRLSDLLIDRGTSEPVALLAGQVVIACYQAAKGLGNDPRTIVEQTQAAFRRVLTLGADGIER